MKKSKGFRFSFLNPKYFMLWLGIGLLWCLVKLPYPLLLALGKQLGSWSQPFLKRRKSIASQNIRLCFPGMSQQDQDIFLQRNFESLGLGLIETGMAWFWSDKRIRKWFDVEGLDNLRCAQEGRRGVMCVGVHFMSLELGGRVMGICQPMMATYRPHNNPLMEWIQTRGRLRSNKEMIDRRDLRGMVGKLKQGEAVWFAPDQDYGSKGSSFVPFFGVNNVATTNGTYVLSRLSRAALLTITLVRKPDGKGYKLHIEAPLQDFPATETMAAAYMNRVIEKEIMRAPEQYMWVHRRFKTRPLGEASLYV
ncbi:kdo(2)-lipid IV(A) palmitoleoyltransferase [Tatumella citrea]|uniref:Lipid A biosynthesis acyltransferase n=1 Tax=Tatumella citrea TaxID=53336 RepID=A0A1Y0L3Z1_TATCI|nr:kdo(2)-lipid IV(A) palmitoleoyltransferase [Tatumella citrea]ARU92721.1 lipid A biosynthesis palmitoleoyl acyltransferase [Tatumella citrea]ARU96759.1 lipid A biosynthesis palmitoleoyl acyltransferase [Tatumella citrea]